MSSTSSTGAAGAVDRTTWEKERLAPTGRAKGAGRFGRTFWMLNAIEMFERLAFFGVRVVAPVYIMQATEPGGLHLTAVHKGWIYLWWSILQSWLPMVTGGYADRFGYKRVLVFAISANAAGYVMMALLHSYEGFFAGILVLATGTAFFKPALQGSLAQNLTKANSSVGWGIFYCVVNVGGFLAPIIATLVLGQPHSAEGWRNLFLTSAAFTLCMLVLLPTYRDVPSGADKTKGVIRVLGETIENIWPFWFRGGRLDPLRGPIGIVLAAAGLGAFILQEQTAAALGWTGPGWLVTLASLGMFGFGSLLATWLRGGRFQWQLRLPAFLLIMACFWMMMYQLWDLHPNFIEDWVDSAGVAAVLPVKAWHEFGDQGMVRVPQQILLNLNAAMVLLLVIPISALVARMRTLSSMLIGMSVATVGILVAGLTGNGWVLLLGIVFFSLGEMLTGPKKNEYLGLIAPPGKKGLYLGYVNIPVGVGVGVGSLIAGHLYDNYGEKATLALKYLGSHPQLVGKAAQAMDWSDQLDKAAALSGVGRSDALGLAAKDMGVDGPGAEELLREHFREDEGQVANLAYVYLAENVERVSDKIAAVRSEAGTSLAGSTDKLPKWTGIKRSEVLAVVREEVNVGRGASERRCDSEIRAMLWERYGADREVLTNLALEYIAQGTPLVADAIVSKLESGGVRNAVEQLPGLAGIGRGQSFAALSSALGVERGRLRGASGVKGMDWDGADVFVYLAKRAHVRFRAVGKRAWEHDLPLLERMIANDPAARSVVEARIHKRSLMERVTDWLGSAGGSAGETGVYARLARKPEIIQEALAVKDWSRSPADARALLGLSTFEAESRASAEAKDAAQAVTRMLWEKYSPQYAVWVPFAAVGVVATAALAVFGRMARRWSDMNA
jgi:MFS family permease